MSEYNKTYKLDGEHFYEGVLLPGYCPCQLLDEIKEHKFDDGDVVIPTYAKCGTSLMQALSYLVLTEDFDHEKPLQQLVPFLELYVEGHGEGKLAGGDYFKYNLAWWELRNDPRVLFVRYEDILKDPEANISKVGTFLDKNVSDETVKKIAHQISFKSMKEDPRYNREDETFLFDQSILPFLRKGKVGDWRNYFTEEQNAYCDAMIEKYFKPVGLDLAFE